MVFVEAEKILEKNIRNKFVFPIDKYSTFYIRRTIHELFPELPKDLVIKAFELCKLNTNYPLRKKDFAKVFFHQIYTILENELANIN